MSVSHDVYYNYFSKAATFSKSHNYAITAKKFRFTDTGWVWVQYSKGSFRTVRRAVPKEVWKSTIDPILRQPTVIVSFVPFCIGMFFSLIGKLIGGGGYSNSNTEHYMRGNPNQQKFKRR